MSSSTAYKGGARFALTCLFAALCSAGAFISLPVPGSPVPIVVQNLFVVLAGLLLGPLDGAIAILIFLAIGAMGFPVFSGGRGGLAHFLGPTGGYLLGYLVAGLVSGFLGRKRRLLPIALASVVGFLSILGFGVLGLHLVKGAGWAKALAIGALPFLPGDALKCVLTIFVAMKLGPFTDSLLGRGGPGKAKAGIAEPRS